MSISYLLFFGIGFVFCYLTFVSPAKNEIGRLRKQITIDTEPMVKIVGDVSCNWETAKHYCEVKSLKNCIADFCFKHCPKYCGCGAGEEAQKLIEKYGSLRRAEKELPFELPAIIEEQI